MNRKQFGILIVLLIILGGAGYWIQQSRDRQAAAGEQGSGKKLLGDAFPVNDVAGISIKQDTNELDLVKKDETWRVKERGDYPANFSQISELLLKLRDLKVVQTESVGASQLPRMQLAPAGQGTNSATILGLKNQSGKSLGTLTLGKKHFAKAPPQQQAFPMGENGFPDGRYMLNGADTTSLLLVGDALANVEPKPDEWLNKDFFKVERPKAVAVTWPVETNSWKIVRDTDSGDWKLADAKGDEKLDAARATDVSNPFASPSFSDVIPSGTKVEGMDKPTVITIDTFDDFTYTVTRNSDV